MKIGWKGKAAAFGGALAPFAAMAQVDTASAVSAFGDAGTAIAAVGAAMVTAAAAGIVYRWVTAFLVK